MKKSFILGSLIISLICVTPIYSQAGWFRSLQNAVVHVVASALNQTASVFNSVLNLVTNCDDSSVDGISTKCFDGNERAKIQAGINVLKSRNYAFTISGQTINAYNHFKAHTSRIVNWDSRQMRLTYVSGHAAGCNGNNMWGCHTVDGTTFLTALGLSLSDAKMSGLLLHEATHFDRVHNCGDSADQNLNGPYGYEAIYLMSVARNTADTAVLASEKALALSRASSIAQYQLCNNANARDEVLNYSNSSVNQIAKASLPQRPSNSYAIGKRRLANLE